MTWYSHGTESTTKVLKGYGNTSLPFSVGWGLPRFKLRLLMGLRNRGKRKTLRTFFMSCFLHGYLIIQKIVEALSTIIYSPTTMYYHEVRGLMQIKQYISDKKFCVNDFTG